MINANIINKKYTKSITYDNRGMDLENLINTSNEYYLDINRAVIYKKSTPIGIDKIEYNPKPIIKRAFFKEASTLDYNGLYKGKYIDFDVKMTESKTSFPLSNIHQHQIKHIRKVLEHGGICFLIILINNETYLLKGDTLIDFIDNEKRKSIPYSFIKENAFMIKFGYSPPLNYLDIVDMIYFKENDK